MSGFRLAVFAAMLAIAALVFLAAVGGELESWVFVAATVTALLALVVLEMWAYQRHRAVALRPV